MELSQRRADAVRALLVKTFQVSEGRITARGYGSARPVADNATQEGRQRNRRVVVTLHLPTPR
jgi:OOP family OmpA-OmpF porin